MQHDKIQKSSLMQQKYRCKGETTILPASPATGLVPAGRRGETHVQSDVFLRSSVCVSVSSKYEMCQKQKLLNKVLHLILNVLLFVKIAIKSTINMCMTIYMIHFRVNVEMQKTVFEEKKRIFLSF